MTASRFSRDQRDGFWFLRLLAAALIGLPLGADTARAEEPAAPGETTTKDQAGAWELKGTIVDESGQAVANAEVLLLADERIIVDAPTGKWFVLSDKAGRPPQPPSTRTDAKGHFEIARPSGGNRVGIIAKDPLFWVVQREKLPAGDQVQIKLPHSGSLAIQLDLPGKPADEEVLVQLCTFDQVHWDRDILRFHFGTRAKNPGKTVLEHLPPAIYAVERNAMTKTSGSSTLMTQCDRRLVTVESGQQATTEIDRKTGQPLKGHIAGLEDVELAHAHLTIHYFGPEEGSGPTGKPVRRMTSFDVIPIGSDGNFKTDPIPPGDYWIDLFAVQPVHLEAGQSDFELNRSEAKFTVPASGETPPLELTARANPRAALADEDRGSLLRVVSADAKPVDRFEVSISTTETNAGRWLPGRKGQVSLATPLRPLDDGRVNLVVRAEGFAANVSEFTGEELERLKQGKVTITLDPGEEVELALQLPEGMSWPEQIEPVVYFESFRKNIWLDWQNGARLASVGQKNDLNFLGVSWAQPGICKLRVSAKSPPFRVAIHVPGFLRFFESRLLTPADVKQGKLAVEVPRPSRLALHFEPTAPADQQLPFDSAGYSIMWKLPTGAGSYLMGGGGQLEAPWKPAEVSDLAPGKYRVSLTTRPKPGVEDLPDKIYSAINPGKFSTSKIVSLEAGQAEAVDVAYVPFNSEAFRGDRTATLRILRPGDTPVTGEKLLVTYFDGHYGGLKVFSGEIPESGTVTLEKISARAPEMVPEPYSVMIDKGTVQDRISVARLGSFGFSKEAGNEEFTFYLPPDVGDPAPDVPLVNMESGAAAHLADFRGKVVLIDFWATWCGPCQEPMKHINQMAAEKAEAWKDRAVVLPISIDDELDTLKAHVASRGWTNLNHYWAGGEGEKTGWKAPAAQAFAINGVPTSLLIDRDGKILWRGHPGGGGLETMVDEALRK